MGRRRSLSAHQEKSSLGPFVNNPGPKGQGRQGLGPLPRGDVSKTNPPVKISSVAPRVRANESRSTTPSAASLDRVTTSLQACGQCAIICILTAGSCGRSTCLLLLLRSCFPPAEPACESAHRRTGCGASAGVAGDRTTVRSKGRAPRRTPHDVTLRFLLLARRRRLSFGRIESALAYSP